MSKRKPFSRRVHREVKFEAANTTFADERFAFEIGKQRQRAQNFMNNISICFLLFPFRKHIKKDISFLTSINERNEDLWRPFLCVLLMLLFRLLNYIYDHIYITSIFFFVKWKKKDGYGRWNERKSFLALMLMFFFSFPFQPNWTFSFFHCRCFHIFISQDCFLWCVGRARARASGILMMPVGILNNVE